MKFNGGRAGLILGAAFLIFASPIFAPQLLAFPHKAETSIGTIRSTSPLPANAIQRVVEQTANRVQTSPLSEADETRSIFLTSGGWRWYWLANRSHGAFALTRPINSAVVVNRSDLALNTITNGKTVGGERTLSSTLAHEFVHGMIRRKYGVLRAGRFPQWKVEGYADHVARESSISAADVAALEKSGTSHPALPYYHGRQRVADILAKNGGDVDGLFLKDN